MVDDYYCKVCCLDRHTKDCPEARSFKLPNTNHFHDGVNYKLFKEKNGKVMAKALGPPDKKHKPMRIWVPKCIVDLERATKLKWVLKAKTQELDGGGPSVNLKIMNVHHKCQGLQRLHLLMEVPLVS